MTNSTFTAVGEFFVL